MSIDWSILQWIHSNFTCGLLDYLMSLAALLCRRKGRAEADIPLEVSGAAGTVNCHVTWVDGCYLGTVEMPLPEKIEQTSLPLDGKDCLFPVVFFEGICHAATPSDFIAFSLILSAFF